MLPNLYIQNEIKSLAFLRNTDYVIYIGPELTSADKSLLTATGVPVMFVQDIIAKLSKEVLEYNFPGVALHDTLSLDGVNARIRSELDCSTDSSHYVVVHFEHGKFVIYDALTSVNKLVWYLGRLGNGTAMVEKMEAEVFKDSASDVRFCIKGNEESLRKVRRSVDKSCKILLKEPLAEMPASADQMFTSEMANAAAELESKVKGLLLQGFPAEIIRSWIDKPVKLSRLRITRQFRILLVDYDEEVIMRPLPKAVFLFFLRHPEGIMFSYLQDYRDELMMIYGHVCTNDDPKKMETSIAALVNPFNNSICEKCAAVKKAFMQIVTDSIARNYYITGEQGKKKGILLDRSLVEWECELFM